MKNIKIYYLLAISCFIVGCYQNTETSFDEDSSTPLKGESYNRSFDVNGLTGIPEVQDSYGLDDSVNDIAPIEDEDTIKIDISSEEMMPPTPSYPDGPYSLELFKVVPDMTFYNPWRDEWVSLSDLYKHKEHKAFILVSSAGWCGPCLMEAAALIELYDKYHADGLEIIYTLGNTNVPGDTPFDTSAGDSSSIDFLSDITFMENWQMMTQNEADDILNYQMYADPNREFIKYLPQHAWPLSLLVTTKDMGVRLVEEGYWSALMENKIMLVLYNDVPTIPFQ